MFWPTSFLGFLCLSSSKRLCDAAVLIGVVLQLALAGLVADGAVERVVDQQVLHDLLLVGDDPGALVWTTMPSRTGVWQDGTSFGMPSTSTRQMRQEATIERPG